MNKKIGFIGAGHMAENLIKGFVTFLKPHNIFTSDKFFEKAQKLSNKYQVIPIKHNEQLLDNCEIIIIAIKPQDFLSSIEPLSCSFRQEHIIFSLMAGIKLGQIKTVISNTDNFIKVIPNTAIAILKGVIGIQLTKENFMLEKISKDLFSPLGSVIFVTEDDVPSFTVACSSGIGFIYEIMQYWQEWLEESGFDKQNAEAMVKNTFLGASLLCHENKKPFLELQKQVTSKKGLNRSRFKIYER